MCQSCKWPWAHSNGMNYATQLGIDANARSDTSQDPVHPSTVMSLVWLCSCLFPSIDQLPQKKVGPKAVLGQLLSCDWTDSLAARPGEN